MALKGRTRFCFTVVALLSSLAWANPQAPRPDLPKNPNDLVREAIQNELKADRTTRLFTFTLVQKKATRTEVKQIVETNQGSIGRLMLINGKPLTPDQRQKEDKRLQRLIADPSAMAAKRKNERADDRRTREMVQALPDAFTYQYVDVEDKAPWGEIAVLKFQPNPNFDPPNQETKVYRGMQGEMWIDLKDMRLAKVDAKIFKEVAFGWGILGHLDPGGSFLVVQKPVYENYWDATHMVLNFTGKVLLFKTLKIREDQFTKDYEPVDNMSVAGALTFLRQREIQVAQNADKYARE